MGMGVYGLSSGPATCFIYDLVNRIGQADEPGMSLVMFGEPFCQCLDVPAGNV